MAKVRYYGRRGDPGPLAALGRLLNELRYPTTRRGKIIAGTIAALIFVFISLLAIGGFLLTRTLRPPTAGETINPTSFLGNTQTVEFQTPDGQSRSAWLFPGLRGAPVVVVCHGYRSSRSEILTLATSLQQHRYNVVAFNFAGHGESPVGYTTLGYKETEELLAALAMLSRRDDVDTERFGLWGYSLGAYAALNAAYQSPRVKAVAVDSIYPSPGDLLRMEVQQQGADVIPALVRIISLEFRMLGLLYGQRPDLSERIGQLTGVPKLFISGQDSPALAELTQRLYGRAAGPKRLISLRRTNMGLLSEEERRDYENLVVGFFQENLPLTPR